VFLHRRGPPRTRSSPTNWPEGRARLVAHFVDTQERFGDRIPQYWFVIPPRTGSPTLCGASLNRLRGNSSLSCPRFTIPPGRTLIRQNLSRRIEPRQFRNRKFSRTRQ
jgi:hypothetical protein